MRMRRLIPSTRRDGRGIRLCGTFGKATEAGANGVKVRLSSGHRGGHAVTRVQGPELRCPNQPRSNVSCKSAGA